MQMDLQRLNQCDSLLNAYLNNYKEKEKSQLLRFQAHWPKENDDLVSRNQEIRGGI